MEKVNYISSKDNQIIKFTSKLQKSSKFRKTEKMFVLEGLRICKDALLNGVGIYAILYSETFYEKFNNEVKSFSQKSDNIYVLSDSLFEKISDTETPQGIIIIAKMPDRDKNFDKSGKYVALDNLQDPSNLGAIARTCEALGVSGIIINSIACDAYSPKSLRSSMGTLIRLPVYITEDLTEFFKTNGLRSLACVVDNDATDISKIDFKNGDVIVIGNEANGISDKVKNNSNFKITIPMRGKAESLNAAGAAAIAIYELMKE